MLAVLTFFVHHRSMALHCTWSHTKGASVPILLRVTLNIVRTSQFLVPMSSSPCRIWSVFVYQIDKRHRWQPTESTTKITSLNDSGGARPLEQFFSSWRWTYGHVCLLSWVDLFSIEKRWGVPAFRVIDAGFGRRVTVALCQLVRRAHTLFCLRGSLLAVSCCQ